MRRRILYTMIAMLVAVGALLGIPLSVVAWWWVADSAHQSMDSRLKTISDQIIRQAEMGEHLDGSVIDSESIRLVLPEDGRLTLRYHGRDGKMSSTSIGSDINGKTMSDSIGLGAAGSLILEIPMDAVRSDQLAAVGIVCIVVAGSMAAGTVAAAVTAGRIADPLIDLADRSEKMARGDFRSRWKTYGIDELDRVSRALGDANAEIALRLEREGEIVGDVSHQIRSRLTAIQLRLDELSLHEDPAVVTEAEAALGQVDRLAAELDELVAASRDDPAQPDTVDVSSLVTTLVGDFDQAFTAAGRNLVASFQGDAVARSARPGRLREAVSVLVDNALQHGSGECRISVSDLKGDMLRITVADEGSGVADDVATDIFRRGFSGGAGNGVGLSLARALVEADGGRLELTSRRPPVFAIVVPAAAGADSAGSEAADGSPTPGDAATRVGIRRDRVPHR
ncbi:HAMP domain-containing histidine kinase [Gordonia otitidis]|uniref:sensor histidine kinase n=1 Tax=Gordonia otitidis TaxID=249058 RepID=UPI001D14B7DA|nr:HAMP domain-containing sensor histidine kinase [Gordonia otitidis]UEA59598.1 HAMP domain-containing histidine kinase [Gordonia otitidis]